MSFLILNIKQTENILVDTKFFKDLLTFQIYVIFHL